MRYKLDEFKIATQRAGKRWKLVDISWRSGVGIEPTLDGTRGSGYVLPALSADIARQMAYVVRGKQHLILGRT